MDTPLSNWRNYFSRLKDFLFQMQLRRGTRMQAPDGLTRCSVVSQSEWRIIYKVEIVPEHPLADWLFYECEGPWAVGMRRPLRRRETFVSFSRAADAMLFRLAAP
jgi:hypothetical protein